MSGIFHSILNLIIYNKMIWLTVLAEIFFKQVFWYSLKLIIRIGATVYYISKEVTFINISCIYFQARLDIHQKMNSTLLYYIPVDDSVHSFYHYLRSTS